MHYRHTHNLGPETFLQQHLGEIGTIGGKNDDLCNCARKVKALLLLLLWDEKTFTIRPSIHEIIADIIYPTIEKKRGVSSSYFISDLLRNFAFKILNIDDEKVEGVERKINVLVKLLE